MSAALSVTLTVIWAGSGDGNTRPGWSAQAAVARTASASSTACRRVLISPSCERDDAGGGEALDLRAPEAELAEHLGGVLAEPRGRAADRGGRRRGADGEGEHLRLSVARLIDLGHEAEVLNLGVVEHLVELVDRPEIGRASCRERV